MFLRTGTLLAILAGLAVPAAAQMPGSPTQPPATMRPPGVSQADYDRFLSQGHTPQDIAYAANAAALSGRSVADVLAMRKAGQSWEQISFALNVPVHRIYGIPDSRVMRTKTLAEGAIPEGGALVAGQRQELGGMYGRMAAAPRFYPAYERKLPDRFFAEGYRLTPAEYHRLRSQGFSQEEVFLIANAARATGLDPRVFADAIYRGLYARRISIEYNIEPERLTMVLPEWRSREWAEATGEPFNKDRLDVWW